MESPSSSRAQLSGEAKETRYISLETGSKISGYTKGYLERLCRLNKMPYRLRLNGEFAPEIGSLLQETHTMLLSLEGIIFLDKSELKDPPLLPSTTPIVPTPAPAVHTTGGREASDIVRFVPLFAGDHSPEPQADLRVVNQAVISRLAQPAAVLHAPTTDEKTKVINANSPALQTVPKELREKKGEGEMDEWDALLLGTAQVTGRADIQTAASEYRPLKTSLDPRDHHDAAHLFPVLSKSPPQTSTNKETGSARALERVIVYEPKHYRKNNSSASALPPESEEEMPLYAKPPEVPAEERRVTGALPSLRVMPTLLRAPVNSPTPQSTLAVDPVRFPTNREPHALMSKPDISPAAPLPHSLMKSPGFNIALGVLVLGPSFLLFGSFMPPDSKEHVSQRPEQLVAGVGASASSSAQEKDEEWGQSVAESEELPFSDEVVVAEGSRPGTLLVQPLFRDGAGSAYEYGLIRLR